jgi:hypothetical protein
LYFARRESAGAVAKLIDGQLAVSRAAETRLEERKPQCANETDREALNFRLAMVRATADWLAQLRPADDTRVKSREKKLVKRVTRRPVG